MTAAGARHQPDGRQPLRDQSEPEFQHMIIGSSFGVYDKIASAIGRPHNFTGIRYYAGGGALGTNRGVNVFPTPWPAPNPRTRLLVSVYPDLNDLLAGRLDRRIRAMIAGAPPGSMLTAWHEVLSLPYRQTYLTPGNVYQMHAKMNSLCRDSHVIYGSLLGGGDLSFLMHHTPPNLGYYGIDLYGNLGCRKNPRWMHPFHRWTQFRDLARTKDTVNHYPWLVIGETNCPLQAVRADWFKLIFSWMHGYGTHALALLTFWNDHGGLSGGWDPRDRATINAMKYICSRYAR